MCNTNVIRRLPRIFEPGNSRVHERKRPGIAAAILVGILCGRVGAAAQGAGDDLFADGAAVHLRIEVPPAAMEVLRRYAFRREVRQEERTSVRCTVREGTNSWSPVALHLKGSMGSFRNVDDAPSFTLNFSKYAPRQRFHGLEKISLNTSVQDPTRVSEKLCRELYTRGGIPVPRAGYATAEWNGRRLGVFVLLEGWNEQFIGRHFGDSRGPLYEGPFLSDIDHEPIVAYGQAAAGRSSIPRLLSAAREIDPWRRWVRMGEALDMDRFAKLLALDFLSWNGDGYALHANNYRIFLDRSQNRLVFLPHGMDQMFTLPDAPLLAGGDGLVASAVLSIPEGRQRVLDHVRGFRNSFFQPDSIRTRALQLGSAVGQLLGREAGLTNGAPPAHTQAVADFVQRITERIHSIDQQLAASSNATPIRTGESLVPTLWTNRTVAGIPFFEQCRAPAALGISNAPGSAGAWVTVQWLEQGRYNLRGVMRRGPLSGAMTNLATCGFRVLAPRKRSLGLDWGWDSRRRAGDERIQLTGALLSAASGTNWAELNCEIDVRQPLAELELLCEASGAGAVLFDLHSLRLTRLTDPGRD
ncbi:MAG: spore coat protein [Verrucomicrobiota bacterium]|jgi:hypothetical protein